MVDKDAGSCRVHTVYAYSLCMRLKTIRTLRGVMYAGVKPTASNTSTRQLSAPSTGATKLKLLLYWTRGISLTLSRAGSSTQLKIVRRSVVENFFEKLSAGRTGNLPRFTMSKVRCTPRQQSKRQEDTARERTNKRKHIAGSTACPAAKPHEKATHTPSPTKT